MYSGKLHVYFMMEDKNNRVENWTHEETALEICGMIEYQMIWKISQGVTWKFSRQSVRI